MQTHALNSISKHSPITDDTSKFIWNVRVWCGTKEEYVNILDFVENMVKRTEDSHTHKNRSCTSTITKANNLNRWRIVALPSVCIQSICRCVMNMSMLFPVWARGLEFYISVGWMDGTFEISQVLSGSNGISGGERGGCARGGCKKLLIQGNGTF